MSVADLLEPIGKYDGQFSLPAATNWMQGRTLYGGASTLIALCAAQRSFPDLPPLRAAQIGFVAPVGEQIEITTQMVRQGRNVTQLRSDILVDGAQALSGFFLFGSERAPNGQYRSDGPPSPSIGTPEQAEKVMAGKGPEFLQNNFELRRAQEHKGPGKPIMRRWIRLTNPGPIDPVEEVVLLGDTLPPSAVRVTERPGPISSINWSFNLLDPQPQTRDGWWLAETASEFIDGGYSSERLRLWNSDGQLVMTGLQAVAVFG